jgi:hypothetical protein
MNATATISAKAIEAELERILQSSPFANAHRSQRFLRYVVECSLKHREEFLKEFAIAVDVFGRNVSYDPSINATVRVEAGRVRSRLREYYADEGRSDALVIAMPKGGYRATFTERGSDGSVPLEIETSDLNQTSAQIQNPRRREWLPLAVTLKRTWKACWSLIGFGDASR